MNVNVAVTVFAAPGLSIGRQHAVTSVMNLFRSKTFPITNQNPDIPLTALNIMSAVTSMMNAPDIVQNLLCLRILMSGRELNMSQSLTENGVTTNNLINLHVIAK
jgi:hypothetical protein